MEAPAALGAEIGLLRELRTKLNGTVHFNIQAYAFERTAWVFLEELLEKELLEKRGTISR